MFFTFPRTPAGMPTGRRWSSGLRSGTATYARTTAREASYSPRERGDRMNKVALVMIWLAVLLAGCGGSLRGDASAGPNPGGGFYGAPNIDIGRINP